MVRKRYKEGIHRQQGFLLPLRLEEYVSSDNPVRAIDAYVDSLALDQYGFQHTEAHGSPGQPAYPPAALLKLYLYGYLQRVRSSRRLERECQRNLEVIWLMRGLRPVYKTIADFRKDNLKAIQAVNRDFVQLCKELDLFGRELAAIDGSFFRGNVSKENIYTHKRLHLSLKRIEVQVAAYLQELEQMDAQDHESEGQSTTELQEKLAKLQERQQQHQARLKQLQESGESQLAEVDEDARVLNKNGVSLAGYNVQAVVDDKHKLLVTMEVTREGNDLHQLKPMALEAKAVLEVDELAVTSDAGYFNPQQIKECQEEGITPYVPVPDTTAQVRQQGRFGREAFSYQPETDTYRCPAGKELKFSTADMKAGKRILKYASQAAVCRLCPLKEHCLPKKSKKRRLARWEHEQVIDEHRKRMAARGEEMRLKRTCLAEHPFGTLKSWSEGGRFLMRGIAKVRAELSLLMLAYNFRRVVNILGLKVFRGYCQKRAESRIASSLMVCFLPAQALYRPG